MRHLKWLSLAAAGLVVGTSCSSAPPADPPQPAVQKIGLVRSTELPIHFSLPPPFLEWLRKTVEHVSGPPDAMKMIGGHPVIKTSAGTFVLMDGRSISKSQRLIPDHAPEVLDGVRQYSDYINSNWFLNRVDPATSSGAQPKRVVQHRVPPGWEVRKQGGRATCVAHAVVAAVEIDRATGTDLSEEYVHHWFMRNVRQPEDCCTNDGVWVLDAGAALRLVGGGLPLEKDLPYDPDPPSCSGHMDCGSGGHPSVLPLTPPYFVAGVDEVPPGNMGPTAQNVGYLEALLDRGFTIVYELELVWGDGANDGGKIIDASIDKQTNEPVHTNAYHAVLLTGYDHDRQIFFARNSFGPDWGHKGEAWLSYRYVAVYGQAGLIIRDVREESGRTDAAAAPR